MNITRKLNLALCLLLLAFISCEKQDEVISVRLPTINDGTIASVEEEDLKIRFIQLSDGDIVIETSFSLDGNTSTKQCEEYVNKIQNMVSFGKAYADIYEELAGVNKNQASLRALKDADIVYKEIFQNNKGMSSEISAEGDLLKLDQVPENSSNITSRTTADCTDLGSDNWSVALFLERYDMLPNPVITPGGVFDPPLPNDYRSERRLNATNFYQPHQDPLVCKSFFTVSLMNASYNSGAQVGTYVRGSGTAERASILPRSVKYFTYGRHTASDNKYVFIWAGAPCPRVHYSILYDV